MSNKITKLVRIASGIALIYLMLFAGQGLASLTGDRIPASIIGMLLLTACLQLGWIKLAWVDDAASLFVRWMSLLFVPIGVGLVDQMALLHSALLAMLVTCVVATLILLALVGWAYQWLQQRRAAP